MIRVLVVDDERDVELLFNLRFRKELKQNLIHLDFAFSGKEALDFLHTKEHPEVVLVLSDINMPGMTGLELLKQIKSEMPDLQVFMITAYGDQQNYNEAMKNGADDFLNKPVDFVELKEKIFSQKDG